MLGAAFALMNLVGAGLLAGEEFVICYGVRLPLARLDPAVHIRVRQALIRRLRILVPAIILSTLLTGVAVLWLDASARPVFLLRSLGLMALLGFLAITLAGTVPINQAVLTWNPVAPPQEWQATVRRWEALDIARCWAALIAFACVAVPMALPLPVLR